MVLTQFDGLLFAIVAVGVAVLLSRLLFNAAGDASIAANSVFGLAGNVIWGIGAVYLIMGGGAGAVFGVVILTVILFFARGHVRVLREENIRGTLNG